MFEVTRDTAPQLHGNAGDPHKQGRQKPQYLCIRRPDGMLVMANEIAMRQSMGNLLPYHGKPDATEAERKAYLRGWSPMQEAKGVEPEAFDLAKAKKSELIEYAQEEFGVTFEASLPAARMRELIAEYARNGAPETKE